MSQPDLIPIPIKQRLHDLRMKLVPVAVFAVTALVAALLWRDSVTPALLVGEVAGVHGSVNSPAVATIARMAVQRFDMVKAGDVIAELSPTDPRQALDMVQNQVGLLRLQADVSKAKQDDKTTQDRMAFDYERLRLELMTEKVALVLAQAKSGKTTMDLEIARGLVNDPAQAKRFTQEAELAKESADAELKERKALVESLGKQLAELQPLIQTQQDVEADALSKNIAKAEARLHDIEKSQNVITLRAPMAGMVTAVLFHAGENVKLGDVMVLITATQPENIVGYLRQPMLIEVEVGQEVEVRTHDRARTQGKAVITHVGVHFEPIINPALHPATLPEVGLPVEISLPPNLRLRPGELVNLVIKPTARPPQHL